MGLYRGSDCCGCRRGVLDASAIAMHRQRSAQLATPCHVLCNLAQTCLSLKCHDSNWMPIDNNINIINIINNINNNNNITNNMLLIINNIDINMNNNINIINNMNNNNINNHNININY